jgi:hypothetical protein
MQKQGKLQSIKSELMLEKKLCLAMHQKEDENLEENTIRNDAT